MNKGGLPKAIILKAIPQSSATRSSLSLRVLYSQRRMQQIVYVGKMILVAIIMNY